jgi:hypothetical protein
MADPIHNAGDAVTEKLSNGSSGSERAGGFGIEMTGKSVTDGGGTIDTVIELTTKPVTVAKERLGMQMLGLKSAESVANSGFPSQRITVPEEQTASPAELNSSIKRGALVKIAPAVESKLQAEYL